MLRIKTPPFVRKVFVIIEQLVLLHQFLHCLCSHFFVTLVTNARTFFSFRVLLNR